MITCSKYKFVFDRRGSIDLTYYMMNLKYQRKSTFTINSTITNKADKNKYIGQHEMLHYTNRAGLTFRVTCVRNKMFFFYLWNIKSD